MADEWDPFADPADLAPPPEAPAASPEAAEATAFSVGDFVELVIAEGPYTGLWIACQLLAQGDEPDQFHAFIPAQPPVAEADAYVPNVPAPLLRKAQSPASQGLMKKHYPLPRPEAPPAQSTEPEHSWYSGKPSVTGRKLRVAVFHGTSSNAKIMGHQISRLRTEAEGRVEFIFFQGKVDASKIGVNPQYELMSKMFPGQDFFQFANYAAGNGYDYCDLDDVMEDLQTQMEEHAPIDGVLGTGQGSNLSTLLAAQAVRGLGMPLSFAVHQGGTEAAWTWRFPNLFGEPLRIPSLHVTGWQDPFLQGRHILAHIYANPEVANHSGDHRPIPRDREEAGELVSNILDFMERAAAAKGGEASLDTPPGALGA